jgi:uncharacterized protein YeaO (DUF488 family)
MTFPSLPGDALIASPGNGLSARGNPPRSADVIKTKRWNDPSEPDDGLRVLVCRYRPRALPKSKETWTLWKSNLGPSRELHALLWGKKGAPISWEEFKPRYLDEMKEQVEEIAFLAGLVSAGKTLTLLCSSSCTDPTLCHRSLLKGLIEEEITRFSTNHSGKVIAVSRFRV